MPQLYIKLRFESIIIKMFCDVLKMDYLYFDLYINVNGTDDQVAIRYVKK